MTVSYEFLPILTGDMATLHSWSDGSTLRQPTLTYSLSQNSDLIVGSPVGMGAAPVIIDSVGQSGDSQGISPIADEADESVEELADTAPRPESAIKLSEGLGSE